jgi:predicted ester cyclase
VRNKLVVRWSTHGTHQGMSLGNPPTGRPVVVPGIIFARTEKDRIVEDWILIDQIGLLQQLEIKPR